MTEKPTWDPFSRGQEYRLTAMTLWRLGDDIVEVVADGGIDDSSEHIKELFDLVHNMEPKPVGLIINSEKDYSVRFSALLEAGN